jgi:hypothetical protein
MKAGDKLVCIAKEKWLVGDGPKYNDIVTFKSVYYFDKKYITFEEYGVNGYLQQYFAPLMDISELTSILESEPITESV